MQQTAHLEQALQNIKENPGKVKPSWDMAQITLEQYYKRNLSQINMIFIVSIGVMLVGFLLISYGITRSYQSSGDKHSLITIVSTSSGILTEFIGATFIFIYNSTIKQAINYSKSLEKINSVGMSITILDSIKSDPSDTSNSVKLNEAKIEIAKILIQQAQESNNGISTK